MVGLSEFVAPPLEKYARQVKVFSKYSEFSFAGNRGTWVRDGDTVIGIDQQSSLAKFGGVQLFRFDSGRRLLSVGRAESATVNRKNTWKLENYVETRFTADGTVVRKVPVEEIRSSLSPDFLGLAVVEPQAMGIRDLRTYTRHLERNSLDASRFEVALWSRIARIAALMLVLILALPFALGPMRNTGQGARTVIGILIGAGFVLLSQTLENSGQILGLSPVLTGWLPTALLAVLTFGMLLRAR
jgi:lipopolysaccharide export system permease protein